MNTDDIIESVGGMSYFQVLMMVVVNGPKLVQSWAMLIMSFAGTAPEWWCIPNNTSEPEEFKNNVTFNLCPAKSNISCSVVYGDDKHTTIDQFGLVCDRKWIIPFVTSIQMGGVLIGALGGGQSADWFGRKKTFFVAVGLHSCFNLVAAFSVSWQMFLVIRFFIGMMIGCLIVVGYPYVMEFVGQRWRTVCTAIPMWVVGVSLFALISWLLPHWSNLHFIIAATNVPFLLCWFVIPESLRFLAVKGRLDEAEKVVDQMCRYNKREKPSKTAFILQQVADRESVNAATGKKYTYIDVFRGKNLWWKSVFLQIIWILMSMVYYGISFGVGRLSGNLYLNIFLLVLVELPGQFAIFFMNNKFGRSSTIAFFFGLSSVAAFGVCIATRVAPESSQGIITIVLALVCKLGVGTAWYTGQMFVCETYPTVIRNLGYGAANVSARIGGIIAPYVFVMGGNDLLPPFALVGAAMAVNTVLSALLTDTNKKPLQDSHQLVVAAEKQNGIDNKLNGTLTSTEKPIENGGVDTNGKPAGGPTQNNPEKPYDISVISTKM